MEQKVDVWKIAKVCHEVNRAYCDALGDYSQVAWEKAPRWQQDSAVSGVRFVLANLDAPASANHDNWLRDEEADGWKYGPVKDPAKKEHPCMVPFDQLPPAQQHKDHLFRCVVQAML